VAQRLKLPAGPCTGLDLQHPEAILATLPAGVVMLGRRRGRAAARSCVS
jgi:hypothetical protein